MFQLKQFALKLSDSIHLSHKLTKYTGCINVTDEVNQTLAKILGNVKVHYWEEKHSTHVTVSQDWGNIQH